MEEKDAQIAKFIDLLAQLGKELADLFKTGNIEAFTDMNATVKEMYRIQHGNGDDVFQTIDPDCDVIYRNFDMIVAVLRTTENGEVDKGAQTAVNKFLRNINEALGNIVTLFGLA